MTKAEFDACVEEAATPYRSSGRYAWHFARGKLRGDPFFRQVIALIPPSKGARILDLGCGQGLLCAWLDAACERSTFEFHGIELQSRRAEIARRALGDRAVIDCCDIRDAEFPRASVVVIADVLHYMSAADQGRVLEKAAQALEPGGVFLLREADASAGFRFRMVQWSESVLSAARGNSGQKFHYRAAHEWSSAMERLGLSVAPQPMSEGSPFANVLYVCRK